MSKVAGMPRPPQRFDLQKFEAMNEPFSIRVEKHRGSTKHEVTPPTPDETGWTKERVRQLENWIVTEWSGGGHYTFAITDSSAPQQTMEWVSYYPPAEFAEKTPPTLQSATSIQPQPPQVPHVRMPLSAVMPPASFYQNPSAMPQVTHPMMQALPQPSFYPQQPQGYGYQSYPPPQVAQMPQVETAELRALREQVNQAREQAAQREFERRAAEIEARSDKRFAELQVLIQQMGQQMVANVQQQRPVVDPAVEQLREANRRLEEQMRLQTEQNERARREQELRDQIRHGQEETRRLVEAANQRAEQMLRESGNKGPDPQFMMMMEAMKEIARSSQTQFDRLQTMMMRPQDILSLAKDSSSNTDQAVAGVTRQFETMFALSRQLTEQAAQLNQGQGGNEVIGLVRDIGDKVGEWAGRYSTGKSREAVEQMRSQAEIARANSDAVRATQDRMAELARLEAALKSGQVVQMPDGSFRAPGGREQAAIAQPVSIPIQPSNGANGHANGKNGKPPWVAPKHAVVDLDVTNGTPGLSGAKTPISDSAAATAPVIPIRPGDLRAGDQRRIKGHTDDEWFGPMQPDVTRLREAVDLFIGGVNQKPPTKPENSASPEECAFAIQQAATEIVRLQIPIPAITDLLMQGSVADFLDVLLPDAPQLYRDDVVKLLMEAGEDDDDDKGDDDDDKADANGQVANA